MTGPIIVDDVIYEKVDENISRLFASEDVIFRRLTFQRTESLVQSEAVLSKEGSPKSLADINQKIGQSSSKSKKKGNQKKSGSNVSSSDGSFTILHTLTPSFFIKPCPNSNLYDMFRIVERRTEAI